MSENPFDGEVLRNAHYRRADMAGSNFDGVNLTEATFYADLSGARFKDSNMNRAVFDDVNLAEVTLNNVNLSGMTVTDANLTNASISNANLAGMTINGILVTELLAAYARQAT